MAKMLNGLYLEKVSRTNINKVLPRNGVYIFFDRTKTPIYIGKSVNLKSRLNSYISNPLKQKTKLMVSEAEYFTTIKVTSELEALLLEARLVGDYTPKYNIELKDDKSPLYIKITKDIYPQIILARKIDGKKDTREFFGPFPSSRNVKSTIKLLRKIFPFSQHKLGKKPCFYSQIKLCSPCPNMIEALEDEDLKRSCRKEYLINVRRLINILKGNFNKVQNDLLKEMKGLSVSEDFEEAHKVKEKLTRLEYITRPFTSPQYFINNPNLAEDIRYNEKQELFEILKPHLIIKNTSRIECFDVAHLAGSANTASMVTFVDGEPDKGLYRKFRIRQAKNQDDISSLKEVAKRRLNHLKDWGEPDLIIVDGGKTQVTVFYNEFRGSGIPTVGLAKRFETLIIPLNSTHLNFKEITLPRGNAKNLVVRLRDE